MHRGVQTRVRLFPTKVIDSMSEKSCNDPESSSEVEAERVFLTSALGTARCWHEGCSRPQADVEGSRVL